MSKNLIPKEQQYILYKSAEGNIAVQVVFEDENLWLTQKHMAELFDVEVNTINYHIKEIFKSEELEENAVIRKIRITAADGKSYETNCYNLDMAISVGYRVNSRRATFFRIWSTKVLKEYMIKGFALDDERLKSGRPLSESYFTELIERIRDIRTSERKFYQKITDIYATSIDYDSKSEVTNEFYATVQNKLHWAIHGHTAAELITERVSSEKPYMGLTSWKNSPAGKIRKSDVSIAKNYLDENELRRLNRFVTMYLDYAEHQAEAKRSMTMKDWANKLDAFLQFNEHNILNNPGKVSAEVAKILAETEFEKYENKRRHIEATTPVSDFDKLVEESKLLTTSTSEKQLSKKESTGPKKKGKSKKK
ncbi:MAG TPA: virulence RhuM family protein [Bacteriovoracaceae bacterium]|nr:virulence RhuM family protein [Bacteriovoracaceae bacterium]